MLYVLLLQQALMVCAIGLAWRLGWANADTQCPVGLMITDSTGPDLMWAVELSARIPFRLAEGIVDGLARDR